MFSKKPQALKCMNCDSPMGLTVLYRGADFVIRSWRCPKCSFAVIHPQDIPKAIELLKETVEV